MRRNLLFYILAIGLFGFGIYLILQYGARLGPGGGTALTGPGAMPPAPPIASPQGPEAPYGRFVGTLVQNLREPFSILLLQLIVIVVAARGMGLLFRRIGQPGVIGEVVAGIMLGPSLLGAAFPDTQAFLFPASSMGTLRSLSQVGVILFMFSVGIELEVQKLREKADAAVLVSHASILLPFFLGTAFSLVIYPILAPPHISFIAFALFLGVAMSITAFPVLARIVNERGLSKSFLGSTALACAAVDDVTAWCILAVVVAIVKASGLAGAMLTVVLTLLFIAAMLLLVRPQVARIVGDEAPQDARGKGLVAGIMALAFTSALFTEVIGIHAIFGAFLAGVVMPSRVGVPSLLRKRLDTFSSVLLLPIFFAFTGLRTQVGLLNDWQSWLFSLGIIGVAIIGKLGGSTIAARWTGMSWHDSLSIGALMNTRGLVELIVLNIGYDLGILSPRIFAMLVLMALVTTFMAGPLLSLFGYMQRAAQARQGRSSLLASEGFTKLTK